MKHIKFNSLASTQTYLKDNLDIYLQEEQDIIVTTLEQPQGLGRQGANWIAFINSISFSFTLNPNEVITLTPLEISVLVSNFFASKHEINIKWPNDLFNNLEEKVGGILCQKIGDKVVIGIGINIGSIEQGHKTKNNFSIGTLQKNLKLTDERKHGLPLEIYNYILANRMSPDEVKKEWIRKSVHRNKIVQIVDDKNSTQGLFIGIGEFGEALLENEEGTCKVFTGSLKIIDRS